MEGNTFTIKKPPLRKVLFKQNICQKNEKSNRKPSLPWKKSNYFKKEDSFLKESSMLSVIRYTELEVLRTDLV